MQPGQELSPHVQAGPLTLWECCPVGEKTQRRRESLVGGCDKPIPYPGAVYAEFYIDLCRFLSSGRDVPSEIRLRADEPAVGAQWGPIHHDTAQSPF